MIDPQLSDDAPASISTKTLRQFAGLWTVFFLGLACWFVFVRENAMSALICGGLALLLGPAGLAKPTIIRPVFAILTTLTTPIGWLVSQVMLLCLFYGVFTPVGLCFRLFGRSALSRRYRPGQSTYWKQKPSSADANSYFRPS